jgi:hypothetical protein
MHLKGRETGGGWGGGWEGKKVDGKKKFQPVRAHFVRENG